MQHTKRGPPKNLTIFQYIQGNRVCYYNLLPRMKSQKSMQKVKRSSNNEQIDLANAFDLEDNRQIQTLIEFVKSLDPDPQSLRTVKKLMLNYGLPILIYLKPFYENFPSQAKIEHQQNFKILAGIADELVAHKQIFQIKFIFQWGSKQFNKENSYPKPNIEFVQFIEQLGQLNESIINKKREVSPPNYKKIVENLLQKKTFSKFMERSIRDYCLRDEQIQQKANKKLQANSSFFSEEQSASSVGQQNFYTQQQTFDYDADNSETNCISFSLNSFSLSYEMAQRTQHFCCRKFFIENQILDEKQDIRTSFLQVRYPFSEADIIQIQKTVCSFLNCEGGKFYIGIDKKNGKCKVVNTIYNQYEKEQVLMSFRKIIDGVEPDIVAQKLYYVDFVPIKDKMGEYIPGANVIRVGVKYGVRDEVYSYRVGEFDYFPFRNDIQIFQKNGRQLLKLYRSMIKNPLPIPNPLHPNQCLRPDIGQPLHSNDKQNGKNKKKKNQPLDYQASKLNSTLDTTERSRLQSKINQIQKQNESLRGIKATRSSDQKNIQKISHHQHYAYFFVIGLGEKHLAPIFAQKNMKQNVQFESNRENRLVIRVHGQTEMDKARKILKKIETKYKEKNIKVYQITLQIQLEDRFDEAIECIKTMKLAHKIIGAKGVRFRLYRESFQAFIELQSRKIPFKFLSDQQCKAAK